METDIYPIILFVIGIGLGLFIMWVLNKSKLSVLGEKLKSEQQNP